MQYPEILDRNLSALVLRLPKSFRVPMVLSSAAASPTMMPIILIGGFLLSLGSSEASKVLLILLVSPLAELLKLISRRARPETLYVKRMKLKTYSFPSGHSYISALVYTFCAYLALEHLTAPASWLLAAVFTSVIFLVGVSRVYLGAHFPSDVLAGWSLGLIASLTIILTDPKII